MELMEHQLKTVELLGNGKILWGGVGAGKSATVLEYYMRNEAPRNIYVITTAKKRDSLDWEKEAAEFGISTDPSLTRSGTIVIDSWNNIGNYEHITEGFFIFDEQKAIGSGPWVKSFLQITKRNRWVLLSATPGDTWTDYAPVFIANGYYENITDFRRQHVVYAPRVKYPKILKYIEVEKLERLRNEVLVEMPYWGKNKRYVNWLDVDHDKALFHTVRKRRWNPFEDRPIKDAAEMFRLMRMVVNSDVSRLDMLRRLVMMCHSKIVIFYNFDYELEMLRTLGREVPIAEWNGHKKEPIPNTDQWLYLVQYTSGAEGWNCTTANAMVFFSMTYSYKNFEQAQGRIDRLDTPFNQLYYYVFVSDSYIDNGIKRALMAKKDFNERKFLTQERAKSCAKSCAKSGENSNFDELELKYGLHSV